jgi:hypothetical protein
VRDAAALSVSYCCLQHDFVVHIIAMALHRHHLIANHALCSAKARTLVACVPQKQYRAAVRGHALPDGAADLPGTVPSVVTNVAVPEGHKSLHNALYGQEGDAHASSRRYNFREVRRGQ